MKLRVILFFLFIAAAEVSSASWFEGFGDSNSALARANRVSTSTSTQVEREVIAQGSNTDSMNAWATSTNGASGEVTFNLAFKGKGNGEIEGEGHFINERAFNTNTFASAQSNAMSAGHFIGDNIAGGMNMPQQFINNDYAPTYFAPTNDVSTYAMALPTTSAFPNPWAQRLQTANAVALPTTAAFTDSWAPRFQTADTQSSYTMALPTTSVDGDAQMIAYLQSQVYQAKEVLKRLDRQSESL